jgi:dTDP-4-amino-4,6-dideoxygalactose transaminase
MDMLSRCGVDCRLEARPLARAATVTASNGNGAHGNGAHGNGAHGSDTTGRNGTTDRNDAADGSGTADVGAGHGGDHVVEVDVDAVSVNGVRTDAGGGTARGNGVPRRSSPSPLALLSGNGVDGPGLPFARPARPPLARVVQRLSRSYESGQLTNGRLVRELEERVAERLRVGHVVAVSSCTSGLLLVVQALVEGRPGPVVLPSFTFSASAHAVAWNGRSARFVDCDPSTFQMDLAQAEAAMDGAGAVMATHVFGAPCTPEEVEKLGASAGVPVLFDAAHAIGATSHERPIGGFGDAEVFSLTPTKPMVAGEGGLIATHDGGLAARLRLGRDYGNPGDYDTRFVGLNARMSEFHAAMALESLTLLDRTLARRRDLAARYVAGLRDVPGIRPQVVPLDDVSTYKDFTIVVDAEELGIDRSQLVAVLAAEGIDTRSYFDPPVHRQQAYRGEPAVCLPTTDAVSRSVVSLPIYPDLSVDDVDAVVGVIRLAHEHADELTAELGMIPAEHLLG